MPYSIQTKDGIKINNIPDDVEPDSDALRQRVAQIRQEQSNGLSNSGVGGGELAEPVLGDTPDQGAIARDRAIKLSQGDIEGVKSIDDQLVQQRQSLVSEALTGSAELAGTIGSSIVAEPLSGLAGIGALIPGGETPAEAIETTREALTFTPRTKAGAEALRATGEALEPVGSAIEAAETGLGDAAFNATGSPAVAAAATAFPTAVLEVLGGAGLLAKKGGKIGKSIKGIDEKLVNKSLVEAAPDIDAIKGVSREIYSEIDNIGAKVKPEAFSSMLKTVVRRAKKENVDSVLTPKSSRVVDQFVSDIGSRGSKSVSDLDQARKKAQIAASSLDPADARVGAIMIDEIDSFMDGLPQSAFSGADAPADVGKRYKAARSLWGRARRAELIQEAMDKAGRQASGFENGIRTQLRAILNNKKRSRFFSRDELKAMDDVVQGSNEQNILKLVGRLGFSEGQATNILGGLAGGAVLGPATPVIGQISRGLAQKATRKQAQISDALVKAGRDGKKITKAYLQATPKSQRSPSVLSQILLDTDADVDSLIKSGSAIEREAAEIAKGRKAFLQGAATGGAVSTIGEE